MVSSVIVTNCGVSDFYTLIFKGVRVAFGIIIMYRFRNVFSNISRTTRPNIYLFFFSLGEGEVGVE